MVSSNDIEEVISEDETVSEVDTASDVEEDVADEAQRLAIEQGFFNGSIPADIPAPPGLPPRRADLARYLAWCRRTTHELEALEEAHHRAIESLGGERTTKAKIDALISADIAAVLKFALGDGEITAKKVRAFERHQLEQKLKDDQHTAEVARASLGEIEREITFKSIALKFLQNRIESFVKAAIAEAGYTSDLAERYLEKIDELHDLMVLMAGLSWATGNGGYCEIKFPKFKFPALAAENVVIAFDENALASAAEPWRKLGQQLVNNPTADITSAFFHKGIINDDQS